MLPLKLLECLLLAFLRLLLDSHYQPTPMKGDISLTLGPFTIQVLLGKLILINKRVDAIWVHNYYGKWVVKARSATCSDQMITARGLSHYIHSSRLFVNALGLFNVWPFLIFIRGNYCSHFQYNELLWSFLYSSKERKYLSIFRQI